MNKYIAQDLSDEVKNIDGLIEEIIKKDYCRVGEENQKNIIDMH